MAAKPTKCVLSETSQVTSIASSNSVIHTTASKTSPRAGTELSAARDLVSPMTLEGGMRRFHEITQRGRVLLTAVVPMTFLAGTAHAQAALPTSAAPAQVSPAASAALQEVLVTAQKRSENIQSVPISVTAVSAEAISQQHATDLQDLQGTLPNVQLDHFSSTPNAAAIYIRGIGVNDPDPYTGNTVSIVVDGVPQYFSDGALVDLLDISQIEVL